MKRKLSIFRIIKYLFLDLYRFIKFLYYNRSLKLYLDRSKVIDRFKICKNCEYFIKKEDSIFFLDRCGYCGCFLKLKTKLKFEECPLKKW